MRYDAFDDLSKARDALAAAEEAHPGCPRLAALHARLGRALDRFSHLLTEEQYVALGGGTPKTPPPE